MEFTVENGIVKSTEKIKSDQAAKDAYNILQVQNKMFNSCSEDMRNKIDYFFDYYCSNVPETFKEVTLDSKEENFFLQVNTTNFPKEMYFTLSATFDEYKFGFDFVNVTNTEETKDEGFDWWLLGIVFVAILVIGIIVAGIFFLYKKEQRNKLTQLATKEDLLA